MGFELLPAFRQNAYSKITGQNICFTFHGSECETRLYIIFIESIIFADAWK